MICLGFHLQICAFGLLRCHMVILHLIRRRSSAGGRQLFCHAAPCCTVGFRSLSLIEEGH